MTISNLKNSNIKYHIMNTSEFIKKLMELTGSPTTGKLAILINKAGPRVSEWHSGKHKILFDEAIVLCERLEIDPKRLFETENQQS